MDFQEKFIDLPSGHKIYTRLKESNHDKWLIVTHGIGEHSGRYDFVFKELSHRYNIFTYDLRSHGRSSGKKGHVNSFSDFKEDLNELLRFLKDNYSMNKFSLFGHSMGGLIVSDFIQSSETFPNSVITRDFYPEKIFLSSPPVSPGGALGHILQKIPQVLIHKLANLPYYLFLTDLFDKKELSHDLRVGDAYVNDPLVSLKLSSKLLLQLVSTAFKVFSKPLKAKCPLYCIVGSADKIVNPAMLEKYSKQVEPAMKLEVLEGGRHELHNEVDRFYEPYKVFLQESLR